MYEGRKLGIFDGAALGMDDGLPVGDTLGRTEGADDGM